MTWRFLLVSALFMVFANIYSQQSTPKPISGSQTSAHPRWMAPRLRSYLNRRKTSEAIPRTPEDVKAWYTTFPTSRSKL